MQNHTMFEFRLLHYCIIEAGFLSLSLVRGHSPGYMGHVCSLLYVVVSLEVELCDVYMARVECMCTCIP